MQQPCRQPPGRTTCWLLTSLNLNGCSSLSENAIFELAVDLKFLNSFGTSRVGLSAICQFTLVNMMTTRPSRQIAMARQASMMSDMSDDGPGSWLS